MDSAPVTPTVKDLSAVRASASVTRITNWNDPAVNGVPAMRPTEASNASPAGSAPVATIQEYGGLPPVAATVPEYAWPTVPVSRVFVVMVTGAAGAGAMIIRNGFVVD